MNMQPIWQTPPYTAEQIDKLQLLRICEDYGVERVEVWVRAIKADLTFGRVPPRLEPGTASDPRR